MSSINDILESHRSLTTAVSSRQARAAMIPVRTPKDIGAVIRDRRRRLKLDQRTLAERVGVSRQWIIDAERGKPRAPITLVLRTLDVLGLSFAIEEAPKAPPAVTDAEHDVDAIVRRARKAPRKPTR
jgi:HTH-type transcriptional regulator/antitoxin HipB